MPLKFIIMNHFQYLARILRIEESALRDLDGAMAARFGRAGVVEKLVQENEAVVARTLKKLGVANLAAANARLALMTELRNQEEQLLAYLGGPSAISNFSEIAALAGRIAKVGGGFFLKKEYAAEILRKRPPAGVMKYLNYSSVEEMLSKEDVTEIFSSLRFIESDEWMHETFEAAYKNFKPSDFEERPIELKVLGHQWREVARKFVAKKHHNVSHLKEFGVIFINPISEDVTGKFLRDFALLLHYFHEIEFYSKMFRKYSEGPDFSEKFISLLRGDVKEIENSEFKDQDSKLSAWLIVQRYLWKENPNDPRLRLPRVNPEAMHWARGERDLAAFGAAEPDIDLELWGDLDWAGKFLPAGGKEELVSFDLEDNAMSAVSFTEGKKEYFTYHHAEAIWTKLFSEYVGGESEMEKVLIENFEKGIIKI